MKARARVVGARGPLACILLGWGMAVGAPSAHAEPRHILDKQVATFQTGVVLANIGTLPLWLDDEHLLVTVDVDGSKHFDECPPTRVVEVEFSARRTHAALEDVQVYGADDDTGDVLVGRRICEVTFGASGPRRTGDRYVDGRRLKLGPDGKLLEVGRLPDGTKRPLSGKQDGFPRDKLIADLGRLRDGWLESPGIPLDNRDGQRDRFLEQDIGPPTVWVRPGKPPMPLAVRFDEISGGRHPYLDFNRKILLNTYDTSGSSDTDAHLHKGWRRPYEYTPFRLLAQDGQIEEIPYPAFVFDYGLASADSRNGVGRNFGEFLPTRGGILVSKERQFGTTLYLFGGGGLFRLVAASFPFGLASTAVPADELRYLSLSPSGCKLAYGHDNSPMLLRKEGGPYTLTIIDLCGDAK